MKNKFIKVIVIFLAICGVCSIAIGGDTINSILSLACMIGIAYGIFYFLKRKNAKKNMDDSLPKLSSEKSKHYEELGMNEQQVHFFRETMNAAKSQIKQLETNMNSTAKLKAINLRNDTIKVAKALFKELVKEPNKLHLADGFLYNHLPNLVELTEKYIEINEHEVKTKNSYEALDKSAKMIDEVSKLLLADYERFVSDDIEDLDVEITIAEQNIARNKQSTLQENEQNN